MENLKEKRASLRKPLMLGVEISIDHSHSAAYEVRDYCSGGMLLIFKNGSRAVQPESLFRGNKVTINLSLPIQNTIKHLKLEAQVARSFDLGIGIAFINPSPAIIHALDKLAENAGPSGEPQLLPPEQNAANRHTIISKCRDAVSSHLFDILHDFFRRADDQLLSCARKATDNQTQSAFFEAIAELSHFHQPITETFHDAILEKINELEQPESFTRERMAEEISSFELSIIDEEEFENWVLVTAMVSKIESQFSEELYDFLQRLSAITETQAIDKENNPFGPAVICRSFCESLKVLHLEHHQTTVVYSIFEQIVTPHLARLYHDISTLFTEAGVLPIIHKRPAIQSVTSTQTEAQQTPREEITPPSVRNTSSAGSEQYTNPESREAFDVALELLNLQRMESQGISQIPSSREPSSAYYDTDEVVEALNTLTHSEYTNLKDELLTTLEQSHAGESIKKSVPTSLNDTFDLMSKLLNAILEDLLLTDLTKTHINQLRVPLVKTALQDSNFFTTPSHPAREFLNLIAQLGTTHDKQGKATYLNPELLRTITRVIERAKKQSGKNNEIFAEAVEGLTPLVNRQDESYERNVGRAIKACEGSQKIKQARQAAHAEISRKLVGKKLPKALLTLLQLGWPKALVITYLQNGPDSEEWLKQLNTLDNLLNLLEKKPEAKHQPNDIDELLTSIQSILGYISFDSISVDALINEFRQLLSTDTLPKAATSPLISIDQKAVDDQLDYIPDIEFAAQDHALETPQESWELAKTLKVNDWIVFTSTSTEKLLLQLIWIAEDHSLYIFVNRKGIKALELTLTELAKLLDQKRITLFEDAEQPLVERGVHRILQEMHKKLVTQATHDPLTGLLNRKEFYIRLGAALENSRQTGATHLLCHLDLDRFNIINNSCGHLAGDTLLKQTAKIFLTHINDKTIVARLGNDEFGLIINHCTESEGYTTAGELREALKKQRFLWEDKQYPVTACIGIALISGESESVGELLKSADSACYAAKNSGFNHIQIYKHDDTQLTQRHEAISWLSRIDTAPVKDYLKLYCQKIAPISNDPSAKPHYEVLLRVIDDQGKLTGPDSFIQAAELAKRMPEVDRWIIRKVFLQMAKNSTKLEELGGFSINLSGCSLNDEGLLTYIRRQLSETRVPTDKICFEITETAAISSLSSAADFIDKLKETGCTFALDDFGSGLSSYSYLKYLAVDFLKIDGIFIKDIATDMTDYAMVKSINELSHYLGKKTIAEYVENDDICNQLKAIGIDFAQGYGIEKPRSLDELLSRH